jgi:uncharacterized protein
LFSFLQEESGRGEISEINNLTEGKEDFRIVNYFLILTDDCNLSCTYCRGREPDWDSDSDSIQMDDGMPTEFCADIGLLAEFLSRDPDPGLIFYGGEPLLRHRLIERIMDRVGKCRFKMYTNGLLLDQLDAEYLARFETIHISIDGPEEITDRNRGRGTYRTIMQNLPWCVRKGFSGEMIARVTVCGTTDIAQSVLHLARNAEYPFDSIHWQLDAGFFKDFHKRGFDRWLETSYFPGIDRLIREWVAIMVRERRVPRWYPFTGLMDDLISGCKSDLRCGSGHSNFTIMPDGTIGPCPVMNGLKSFYLGHIAKTYPSSLPKMGLNKWCLGCDIRGICGGRCYYMHEMGSWPEEGRYLVCESVRHLIRSLFRIIPEIRTMIDNGTLLPDAFTIERFNGCEIIP